MKPTYTSAEPVSLSPRIASIGRPMIAATASRCLRLDRRNDGLPIRAARTSDVVILDISAGWNLTGPSSNQECDPLTSLLTKITRISRKSTAM